MEQHRKFTIATVIRNDVQFKQYTALNNWALVGKNFDEAMSMTKL